MGALDRREKDSGLYLREDDFDLDPLLLCKVARETEAVQMELLGVVSRAGSTGLFAGMRKEARLAWFARKLKAATSEAVEAEQPDAIVSLLHDER